MKAQLGKGIELDIDRLIASRLLVQANSGGGKSWALRRLFEQTHGKVQHLVIDFEGEFYTLRERFDYVLASRQGGDALLSPQTAPMLAHKLLELGASAILDLYEWSVPERIRIVRLFLEALIDAPRKLWHPVLVPIDEAHVFCPQNGKAESAPAVMDLMSRGRKRGFCGVLATQRIAKLHKDAAAEANCKLIGRAALDVDLQRAGAELGFTTHEQQQAIRNLHPGHFFAFGPGLSDDIVEFKIGPVETTHPKAGDGMAPVPPPRAKVRSVLAQLKDLPQAAAEEARTLAQAKGQIVELERKLRAAAKAQPPAPAAKPPKTVKVPTLKAAEIRRIEKAAERGAVTAANFSTACEVLAGKLLVARDAELAKFNTAAASIAAALKQPTFVPLPLRPEDVREIQPRPRASSKVPLFAAVKTQALQALRAAARPVDASGYRPSKCATAILSTLAQHGGCTIAKLALLAGYTRSGTFSNELGALRTNGFIDGQNTGTMTITDTGRELVVLTPRPTGPALIAWWKQHPMMSKCSRAIIDALAEHPAGLTIDALATTTSYSKSGTFSNELGALRTAGLLVGRNTETMRLADELL